jgi:metallo-beta-lactamase family protein
VELAPSGRVVVVSGDLGRPGHRVLRPPQSRPAYDVMLLESTCRARERHDEAAAERLAAAIRRTAEATC